MTHGLKTFCSRQALYAGAIMVRDRPLSASTATQVCSEIRGTEVSVRTAAGTHIANSSTGQIVYAPPVESAVIWEPSKEGEGFIHDRSELDPPIVMAALHYQVEAVRETSPGANADLLDLLFEQACIRVKGWWTPPESRVSRLQNGCANWLPRGC